MSIKEKALALVDRLGEIENNDSYNTILVIAATHGFRYTGPTWDKELKELQEALKHDG